MIVGRGVEKVEGRCGGAAVLVGTRLCVRCIEGFRQDGGDPAVIRTYPYLTPQQRLDAYDYALLHEAELAAELTAESDDDHDALLLRAASVDATLLRHQRAITLLRKIEAAGQTDDCSPCCPCCEAEYPEQRGHVAGCELAELIGAKVAS